MLTLVPPHFLWLNTKTSAVADLLAGAGRRSRHISLAGVPEWHRPASMITYLPVPRLVVEMRTTTCRFPFRAGPLRSGFRSVNKATAQNILERRKIPLFVLCWDPSEVL